EVGTFGDAPIAPAQCADTDLWGFIDSAGAWRIEPCWLHVRPMLGDLAPVCDAREQWGAIDVSGEAVIAPAYDGLYGFADAVAAFNVGGTNLNGVATMGGKWGIIDAEGTEVCAPRFDMLTGFSDGIASGTEQGCAVIVDRAGEVRW